MAYFPILRRALHKPEDASWAAHMRWLAAMQRYCNGIMKSPCPSEAPNGVFTAILLNYRRPQNMELLARMLLQVPLVSRVIVSNNNPKCDLLKQLHFRHPRLSIVQQPIERPCAFRYFLAQEDPSEYFLFLDDDLFLLPSQVRHICEETVKHPSVAHGMFGQRLLPDGSFRYAVSRFEGRIDVINRCYAFACPLLHRWHVLLKESGLADDMEAMRMGWWDDILLSFTGDGLPFMHDTGPYLDCGTQGKRGVAVWREPEFFSSRDTLFRKLKHMQPASLLC